MVRYAHLAPAHMQKAVHMLDRGQWGKVLKYKFIPERNKYKDTVIQKYRLL